MIDIFMTCLLPKRNSSHRIIFFLITKHSISDEIFIWQYFVFYLQFIKFCFVFCNKQNMIDCFYDIFLIDNTFILSDVSLITWLKHSIWNKIFYLVIFCFVFAVYKFCFVFCNKQNMIDCFSDIFLIDNTFFCRMFL